MESLPTKCLCGHRVGNGSHLLVCKRVNSGQIAAHDDAVRRIGAELNDYGVVVRYEQRADRVKGKERKLADRLRTQLRRKEDSGGFHSPQYPQVETTNSRTSV
jgi:hypothetical protein